MASLGSIGIPIKLLNEAQVCVVVFLPVLRPFQRHVFYGQSDLKLSVSATTIN